MFRISIMLGTVWAIGTLVLLAIATSRLFFDDPPRETTPLGLFLARVFVAFFWWLMILSSSGRQTLVGIWKGDNL